MLISCWNVRGLNQPQKQREIVKLIHDLHIDVFGIVETKVRILNEGKISNNMMPTWNFITNGQVDSVGRIWVGWNPDKVKLTVLSNTPQMIHTRIEHSGLSITFEASFVYGLHTAQDRRPLWTDINTCANSVGSLPWIALGDFNAVLHSNDVFGSTPGRDQGTIDFNACVNASCLVDLRYTGCFYSWNNRRSDLDSFIKKKLDRALVNQGWLAQFPSSFAEFLPSGISDHSPIIIHISTPSRKKGMPFKFYNYWTSLDKFSEIVNDSWNRPIEGNFQFQLCHKLRSLKVGLKTLSRELKRCESLNVDRIRADLYQCQIDIESQPSNSNLKAQEKHLLDGFLEALRVEEEVVRQKSRIQWLDKGDRNTAYFHNAIKNRRNRNRIVSLVRPDGSHTKTEDEAKSETIRYFRSMLGTTSTNPYPSIYEFRRIIKKRVPIDQISMLDRIPTSVEIKETIFSLNSNKAPGPDGFNAHFFKETWNLTGPLVIQAITEIFYHGGNLS